MPSCLIREHEREREVHEIGIKSEDRWRPRRSSSSCRCDSAYLKRCTGIMMMMTSLCLSTPPNSTISKTLSRNWGYPILRSSVRVQVPFGQFESHFEGLMDQNEMVFAFIISLGILSRNFQKFENESHLESTPHFRDQWTDLCSLLFQFYIDLYFRLCTVQCIHEIQRTHHTKHDGIKI